MSRRHVVVGYGGGSPYFAAYKFDDWRRLADPDDLPTGDVYAVDFNHDGTLCAVGFQTAPYLIIYDTTTTPWTKIADPGTMPADGPVYDIAFSPDGSVMALGYYNGGGAGLLLYDTSDWSDIAVPAEVISSVEGITWSPDGAYMAVSQSSGGVNVVAVFDTSDWSLVSIDAPPDPIWSSYACEFSPDGNYLVAHSFSAGAGGNYVVFWDTSDWSVAHQASVTGHTAVSFSWKHDSSQVAAGTYNQLGDGRGVKVWDVPGFSAVLTGDFPAFSQISEVEYSWDDRWLYCIVDYDVNFIVLETENYTRSLDMQPSNRDDFYFDDLYGNALALAPPDTACELDNALPSFSLLALDTADYLYDTLPVFTLGADGQPGSDANVTLPVLTLSADGYGDTIGAGSSPLNLPVKTLLASPGGAALEEDFPLITLDADSGPEGSVDRELPALTMEAAGEAGGIASYDVELPNLVAYAYGDEGVAGTLPALEAEAAGYAGAVAEFDQFLPSLEASASGIAGGVAEGEVVLPLLASEGVGWTVSVGVLVEDLPSLLASGQSFVGSVGVLSVDVPLLELEASGFADVAGELSELLPMVQMIGLGLTPTAENYRTWVLNMRNGALTEYTGWAFNSYANFAGRVLAASDDGLFTLGTESLDDEAAISAAVAGGSVDMGTDLKKRLPYVYAGLEAPAPVYVKLTTAEGGARSYTLAPEGTGLRSRRVKTGLGEGSRYWKWEIGNTNGGNFRIESVSPYFEELKRRLR